MDAGLIGDVPRSLFVWPKSNRRKLALMQLWGLVPILFIFIWHLNNFLFIYEPKEDIKFKGITPKDS